MAKSGQSNKSPRCKCLTASTMCFGEELDLIKLMMCVWRGAGPYKTHDVCFGEELDLINLTMCFGEELDFIKLMMCLARSWTL